MTGSTDVLGPNYQPDFEPTETWLAEAEAAKKAAATAAATAGPPMPEIKAETNTSPESVKVVTPERFAVAKLDVSEKGLAFLIDWEKLRLDYYDDEKGFCTVGIGHLVDKKSCKSLGLAGKSITRKEAESMFLTDGAKYIQTVRKAIKVPLLQQEFDALCSLAFNMGSLSGAPSLVSKLNAGDYAKAPVELLDITNNGSAGLVKRRKQEYEMFVNGNYNSKH